MHILNKSLTIIVLGVINMGHILIHVVQVIQSLILAKNESNSCEHISELSVENILITAFWVIVAITTIIIGVKDYIHHIRCDHK